MDGFRFAGSGRRVHVAAGYLILITGTLFVEGARTVIQTEQNKQKLMIAGVSFWIGAAFQFDLFTLPNLGSVWGTLVKSGVTTGGFTAIVMILFLEFTSQRRIRFESKPCRISMRSSPGSPTTEAGIPR